MSYTRIELPLDRCSSVVFEEDGIVGQRSILPGGIRVLTEKIPGQRSVSLSFWIGAGSRDELSGREGSTHFLEHMLFKGTSTRSSLEISQMSDFLGGAINAATSRQYTCYYGRVFAADMPQMLELLVDMVTDSVLDPTQMEIERGVILEELAAAEDDVSDVAETAILPMIFGDHPLARPVGGTRETVSALDHSHMLEHYREYYNSRELVVTAAGDVNHEELCAMVLALLDSRGWNLGSDTLPMARRRAGDMTYGVGGSSFIAHPSHQSAVVVGMPGLYAGHDSEITLMALDSILGGGTSSRLFQEVRERRGLAYSTYSWCLNWLEGGVFALEAACSPENTGTVARIMQECLEQIAEEGVSEQEVDTAYNQRRAQLVFSAETNGFRKNRLGQAELIRGDLWSIEESLRRSREVTAQDIQALAQKLCAGPRSVVICGSDS
ncbi:M16 family metallopeptidase [Arcanobacterium bovis]|uniref:Insulinase family protein n=1 Tax=Arcanobacterium bovis TaxID=2529275 RepID=A0A4Q9V139_9ACTO|nr:pitrilysin family protein [Arcanobacterium bovis]TBW22733.1 insulinase family protein [Arcanobacterium bovis]